MNLEKTIRKIEELRTRAYDEITASIRAETVFLAIPRIEEYLSCALRSRDLEASLPPDHPLRDTYAPEDAQTVLIDKVYAITGPETDKVRALFTQGTGEYRALDHEIRRCNQQFAALDIPELDEDRMVKGVVETHAKKLGQEFSEKIAEARVDNEKTGRIHLHALQGFTRQIQEYQTFARTHSLSIDLAESEFPIQYGLSAMDPTGRIQPDESILEVYCAFRQATHAYAAQVDIDHEQLTGIISGYDDQVIAHEIALIQDSMQDGEYQELLRDEQINRYTTTMTCLRSITTKPETITELDLLDAQFQGIIDRNTPEILSRQDELYRAAETAAESGIPSEKETALAEFSQFTMDYASILEEDQASLQRVCESINDTFRVAYHDRQMTQT
jgi:hypothetical protein